jgi:hypothetical protein
MSSRDLKKDPEILAVLDALRESLGAEKFKVVDHWSDDSQAIGVASPSNEGVLVYISASPGADEPYFFSLEYPPDGEWSDNPYTPVEDRSVCELEELVQVVARHLLSAPTYN